MNRETFEQLISQWLDNPADDDLRRRVEQAVADTPELLADRRQAERIEQGLRAARAHGPAGDEWGPVCPRGEAPLSGSPAPSPSGVGPSPPSPRRPRARAGGRRLAPAAHADHGAARRFAGRDAGR